MHFSKTVCAIAIVAGPISSVLGALTYDQLNSIIQKLIGNVDNAIADVNNVNLVNGDIDTNVRVVTKSTPHFVIMLSFLDTREK